MFKSGMPGVWRASKREPPSEVEWLDALDRIELAPTNV